MFSMIVPVFLSINMDMVLKCKLGHLIRMDFSNFKQFIFPSTHLSFSSRVLTLSRDIGHDFEITVFTGENLTFTFITNAHYSIF